MDIDSSGFKGTKKFSGISPEKKIIIQHFYFHQFFSMNIFIIFEIVLKLYCKLNCNHVNAAENQNNAPNNAANNAPQNVPEASRRPSQWFQH